MAKNDGLFSLRNFTKPSGSGLPDGEERVKVSYVLDGISDDQVQWLVEDACTRLYAQDVARPGSDKGHKKHNSSTARRFQLAREERRFSMHMKNHVMSGTGGVETQEQELERRLMAGESSEDIVKDYMAAVQAKATEIRARSPNSVQAA